MGIVAEKDSTTQPTTRLDLSASLQEMKKADNQLDFKQYTNRQKKQAFLIVHNSESFLQRVSADHTLLSIGMKANSIYQITGRPVPPTIDQTIGAASNMISPDMGRAETNAVANPIDVSTACVMSPFSATSSNDIFFAEVVDDTADDIHPDHLLGRMELTDEYIHSMHIIPHMKTSGEIQFRAIKLDS